MYGASTTTKAELSRRGLPSVTVISTDMIYILLLMHNNTRFLIFNIDLLTCLNGTV